MWAAIQPGGKHRAGKYSPGETCSPQRPPIYPLLLRITDFSHPLVIAVQTVIYAFSWIFLAACLWQRNVFIAATVFYVALYPGFAAWNTTLMTESLSISMTVLCFGCLARCLSGYPSAVWAFVLLLALKCFLRNFDAIGCIFYLPVVILLAAGHIISWMTSFVSAAILICTFMYFSYFASQYADYTWYFALLNDVGMRVLPNPRWLAYFVAHEMPISPKVLSMTGHWAYENNWRFFDPDLVSFRAWLRTDGRSTYTGYLLLHPHALLSPLWLDAGAIFQTAPLTEEYFDRRYAFGVPPWPSFSLIYIAGTTICLGFAAILWRGAKPVVATSMATALLVWAMVPLLALAAFHADASDIPRHCLPVALQAALSLLLMMQVVSSLRRC